ncbi:MAG TPA: DUF4783 domain-containing protein [Bacteroidales bacterium]|nr:DUF4783 domain-containing protein [Bacteroidales bacterium]
MKIISCISFFLVFQCALFSQNNQEIYTSLEKGDVETLSDFLDNTIDLTVLKDEGIYSKSQAKVILKSFFAANSPGVFTLQHQGGNEQSSYIIGTLQTKGTNYRVYYLSKKNNNKTVIQKLRIEYD